MLNMIAMVMIVNSNYDNRHKGQSKKMIFPYKH